jgi:hypothetical protein
LFQNIGLLKNQELNAARFPVIDSSDGEFELQRDEKGDDVRSKQKSFKLVLKDSTPGQVCVLLLNSFSHRST